MPLQFAEGTYKIRSVNAYRTFKLCRCDYFKKMRKFLSHFVVFCDTAITLAFISIINKVFTDGRMTLHTEITRIE